MIHSVKHIATILVVFSVCCFTGTAAAKLPVFVSVVPQKYFVQQIGGDLVDVQAMVRPGASPATYEPRPGQMAALAKTRIFFAVGAPFENTWLPKIAAANPRMMVVHTDHGIEKLAMQAHDHNHGTHNENGHPQQGGLDPHVWLSPPLVKVQARAMLRALQEADPAHQDAYAANFEEFSARIDDLDNELRNRFAGRKGLQFMVFHPSWGYFAHAYGLEQVAIEIEGKDPKPAQLKALIEHARDKGIKIIFAQPQFSAKSAQVVAREIGGQVVLADPLAENWMENLREISLKFQSALK